MINFNGTIISEDATVLTKNRAFLYGDAVFLKQLKSLTRYFSRRSLF
jgi:hypothetical protein